MALIIGTQIDKKRNYSEKEKIEILTILRDNGYDYMRTKEDTGVAYNTLVRWNDKYADRLSKSDAVEVIAKRTELKLCKMKESFLQQHFDNLNLLASKGIKKAIELMEKEEDLNKVSNSMKVIGELFAKLAVAEGGENANTPQTVNLIQQSITMMNEIHKKDL